MSYPITDQTPGCPGLRLVTGRTIGICIACELRDRKSAVPQLVPAAKPVDGIWSCVDRVPAAAAGSR